MSRRLEEHRRMLTTVGVDSRRYRRRCRRIQGWPSTVSQPGITEHTASTRTHSGGRVALALIHRMGRRFCPAVNEE